MKILVVSDTHGRIGNYMECIRKVAPIDMLIHCGDIEGQEEEIKEMAGCETHIVSGNNDYFSALPREDEFMIGSYRAFLTHGHGYGVSMGLDRLVEEAEARGADIVLFGHTHRPVNEKIGNVRVLNPGSLSYPRQEGRDPSYIVIEFDQHGKLFSGISYL
ncbi:MAG: metallophosphoesterase [Lachnospiraceae bacterium]|nr:metallophosphoesterase [Lachnospiraceae bacterium]